VRNCPTCGAPKPNECWHWGKKEHRLFSAAPSLLDALKLAVKVMQDNGIDESMAGEFEVFTDAMSKAQGDEE